MRVKPGIRKCINCNSYTLKINCRICGAETISPKPARYSPDDKYGSYRRKLKKMKKE